MYHAAFEEIPQKSFVDLEHWSLTQRCLLPLQVVLSKAADLTRNHDISIKLLAVPQSDEDSQDGFDMSKFWRNIISDGANSDEHAILESFTDLAQHITALIRPTAITIPSGRFGFSKPSYPVNRGPYDRADYI